MLYKHCLTVWPNHKTIINQVEFVEGDVFEKMFDKQCFAAWPNCETAWQVNFKCLRNRPSHKTIRQITHRYILKKSNDQTFCLASEFQMFDKQCLIVWPGPNADHRRNLKS